MSEINFIINHNDTNYNWSEVVLNNMTVSIIFL